MPDIDALIKKITDSGIPIAELSRRTGIRRETLYNRFNGIGEFTASEISAFQKALKMTKRERDTIFFAE